MTAPDLDVETLVSRQRLWRFVNERIFELEQRQGETERLAAVDWARCECGRRECDRTVAVGADAYTGVRTVPTRFLVVPGHEFEEFERIVETHGQFAVVETFGRAAEIAASSDVPDPE